jgi:hypothetical protein
LNQYHRYINFIILFAGVCFTYSCNQEVENNEPYIARYKDIKLNKSDITSLVGNTTGKDSIELIRTYAEQWLKEQILLDLANTNLITEQKDITRDVEHYRNTLLIYKYHQEYIRQHLDTTFTKAELEEYYNSHFGEYFLEENILQALFIQVPKSAPRSDFVKRFYQSEKPKDVEKLDQYCNKNAYKYDDFRDKWVSFSQVQNYLPEVITDQETFLQNNKYFEMADTNFYYFLKIKDYKLKGSHAPFEFATEMIKPALINKRKNELILNLETGAFNDAIQNKDAEIKLK